MGLHIEISFKSANFSLVLVSFCSCRARDIGVWFDVMRWMVFVGILTNCAILGFSSEQMMQWLPSLFTRSISDGDQLMALGSGRYIVHPHFYH